MAKTCYENGEEKFWRFLRKKTLVKTFLLLLNYFMRMGPTYSYFLNPNLYQNISCHLYELLVLLTNENQTFLV